SRGEIVVQVIPELDDAIFDGLETAEEYHAIAGELVQVDGMAAPGAGDMRLAGKLRLRRRQLADSPIVLAHFGEPPVRVLAAIAARRSARAACREIDLSPGFAEFFGDLCAGLRAADDQYGAREQLLGVAIIVGMKLLDLCRKVMGELRNLRSLIKPRRDDDVVRPDGLATIDRHDIVAAGGIARDGNDARAGADRQPLRHLVEVRHDFLPWHEAVRIILAVTNSRQSRLPSRRVEREGVPTVIAPGFARLVRLFENHVVNGQPFQIVADRKAGLPSADDDGVCASQHDTLLVTTERRF